MKHFHQNNQIFLEYFIRLNQNSWRNPNAYEMIVKIEIYTIFFQQKNKNILLMYSFRSLNSIKRFSAGWKRPNDFMTQHNKLNRATP